MLWNIRSTESELILKTNLFNLFQSKYFSPVTFETASNWAPNFRLFLPHSPTFLGVNRHSISRYMYLPLGRALLIQDKLSHVSKVFRTILLKNKAYNSLIKSNQARKSLFLLLSQVDCWETLPKSKLKITH